MKHKKRGFILISTFMFLSVLMIVVMRIYYKGSLYNLFIPAMTKQMQAKKLALSGVQIALAQLSLQDTTIVPIPEDEDKKKKSDDPKERRKNLLKTLWYVQNRWQTFKLDEDIDGIEGDIGICITCEDGKIPLGALINYDKRSFVKSQGKPNAVDGEDLLKLVFDKMKPFTKDMDLLGSLQREIKKLKFQFNDVGELLKIKEFKVLRNNLYYQPLAQVQDEEKQPRPEIYLADLFTLWNDKPTVDPLLLSPSVRLVLGLGYPNGKAKVGLEAAEKLVEKFSFSHSSWEKDWDTYLQPQYKKDFKSLSKLIQPLLSLKFGPRVFSVLCYGKLGRVQQKLIAVIERSFTKEGEVFSVKKLYWI